MADRVSASITIGGSLPVERLDEFVTIINDEGLSFDYEGGPIAANEIVFGEALTLSAHEVAWGIFNLLEAFCHDHQLAYSRWSGACPGAWGSTRNVFRGTVDMSTGPQVDDYDASDDDHILMSEATARSLETYDAIIAHFERANFVVPPLGIVDVTASRQTDATACPA